MQVTHAAWRALAAAAASMATAAIFAGAAAAQLQADDILVVDPDVPPVSSALLFQVDPQTGARTVLHSFGASSPSSVAVDEDGDILVTDTDAGTDPNGGTAEWGALYRLIADPATGELTRTTLTDFGTGPSTRAQRRVRSPSRRTVTSWCSTATAARPISALLVRVDPDTGARAILSDFGNAGQGGLGIEPRGVAIEAGGTDLRHRRTGRVRRRRLGPGRARPRRSPDRGRAPP